MHTKMAMGSLILLVGILYLSCFGDAAGYMKYKDPKRPIEDRVTDLLNRMTLAEKIGQMSQIDRTTYTHPEFYARYGTKNYGSGIIKTNYIGSILFNPRDKGSNTSEWIRIINNVQKEALETRLGIPVLFGVDAVHGHSSFINTTIFPHNVGLGVTRDPDLVRKIGAATALEVRATGIPWVFAPCVAVCRDPRWGRCFESYSEDPKLVAMMTEIITGLQGQVPEELKNLPYVAGKDKVAACVKHFIGDGGTNKGINENDTITTYNDLHTYHMPPYEEAIPKGVSTVMASYSSVNGVKMHANHDLITRLLKEMRHFEGFVISDWEGIDRITSPERSNYTYSIEASINAGIDMVMIPYQHLDFINGLTKLVDGGFVPMSRIDDAVSRILRVKFTLQLFENPFVNESTVDIIGCKEHRELAREAVRKSMVLLKNGKTKEQKMLPLPKKVPKILVAGGHADDLGWQCGGFTLNLEGFNGTGNTTGTTILQAIQNTVDKSTKIVYQEVPTPDSVKNHSDASYGIVVVGERPYAETSGDNSTLALPNPGSDVIKYVCGSIKCVVVLVTGRPLVIEPYLEMMNGLAVAWLPGTEGQGVADVLFGDYPFTGKLARTWMRNVKQLPLNVNQKPYDPLFPFGFGLQT